MGYWTETTNASTGTKSKIWVDDNGRPLNQPAPGRVSLPLVNPADFGNDDINMDVPTSNYKLDFDPLLSPTQILAKAGVTPGSDPSTGELARDMVAPLLPGLRQGVEDLINKEKSSAQSAFLRRGITGSSTEIQTLTRDLPEKGFKTLADAETKLLTDAIPLAQQEKQIKLQQAQFATSLRTLIGNEKIALMSFEQKEKLFKADAKLKTDLTKLDQKFQAKILEAQQKLSIAQDEQDRQDAMAQLAELKAERKKARQNSFYKSLTQLAGFGFGFAAGGPAGAEAGSIAGNIAGELAFGDF